MSAINKAIVIASKAANKDLNEEYQKFLGGVSIPQEKLFPYVQSGKMKYGGSVKKKNGRRKK
jgi:hypothetical protein